MLSILHEEGLQLCESVYKEIREKLLIFGRPFEADYYSTIIMQFYRRGYMSRDSLLLLAIRSP